ncbi:MAG: hypothetical protein II645_04385 [Bacteroidaceae bacterium]|nr:hypothetical protein [Bacteroidaceae bacterium]
MKKHWAIFLLALLATLSCTRVNMPTYPPIDKLPGKVEQEGVKVEHFPSMMHTFIWRNWGLVPTSRLAEVLGTSERNVRMVAVSMGLEARPKVDPVWTSSKGYITLLKRNWHILPYEQILVLLNMTQEQLEWNLFEDDFLFTKLGKKKPQCERLTFHKPTKEMNQRAAEIAELVRANKPGKTVPRFDFFSGMPLYGVTNHKQSGMADGLRMVFSYNAIYGDPLMDAAQSSYSDELLARLSALGINAVWVHSVLRMLVAPEGPFPGDENYKERLENLNTLVKRAAKYGIRVMMYVNEPRALPKRWFDTEEKQSLAGLTEREQQTFCTSDPRVLKWLSGSFERVFKAVPGLGGVFIISMSENLTNCASHKHQNDCPRCAKRPHDELLAEVNNTIADGVLKGNPDAKVLVWDWGWDDSYAEQIINRLDKRCTLLSVSEWSLPINRGGVASKVGEYSISAVGPGPRAVEHWKYAKAAGLQTAAKVMVNATWEVSSIPVIPAMDLIASHASNLGKEGVKDVVMTWSVGGYPSINFAVFQKMLLDPSASLDEIANDYYGEKSGPVVRQAWKEFSDGFKEYPYNINVLYSGPQHLGPANLFYPEPTGWHVSMVGFPYDDLDSWRRIYPADVYISQIRKVAKGFERGASLLEQAIAKESDSGIKKMLQTDYRRAQGFKCIFNSVANQATFILCRDKKDAKGMRQMIDDEILVVKEFMPLCDEDPTFGYESSNHYYFVRQDLLEKLINLEFLRK